MNRDRYARSGQPVQRLDRRPSQGDRITYQDNKGHVLEADDDEGDDDDVWPPRVPNSSIRYVQPYQQGGPRYHFHPDQVQRIPARRSAQPIPPAQAAKGARTTETVPTASRRPKRRGWFRAHPLLWLGVGMLLMLGLWQGLTAFGTWWSLHQDDVTYGRPRTAQYDQVVGHHDDAAHPTHFIALNLNAQVLIIELPGGDSSKAKIYQGPHIYGLHADLDPITLQFRDVDGDGTVDMIVTVQGAQIIYLNQNEQFVLQPSH